MRKSTGSPSRALAWRRPPSTRLAPLDGPRLLRGPAERQTGAPGDDDSVVDLFNGPGGVEAWAIAAPTKQSLGAYTTATTRASAAAHPCPATPQTDQAITIGGEPARLLNMQCPAGSGFLVEIATTIHDGTAYVFTSQNPTGSGDPSADRAAFRAFLAGIQLQQ